MRLDRDRVWLSQEQMRRSVVTGRLRNVFAEGNWDRKAMCKICTLPGRTSRCGVPASTPVGSKVPGSSRADSSHGRLPAVPADTAARAESSREWCAIRISRMTGFPDAEDRLMCYMGSLQLM